MRKIISSLAVGSIAFGLALALAPIAAQAETLLVTVTDTGVPVGDDGATTTITASWDQSSNPTPITMNGTTQTDVSTDVPVWNYTASYPCQSCVTDVVWYNPDAGMGGGLSTGDYVINVVSDQAYSGGEFNPSFAVGVFPGTDYTTGGSATITIRAVPEASTWALMLLGFAGLGLAGYRASRKGAAVAA